MKKSDLKNIIKTMLSEENIPSQNPPAPNQTPLYSIEKDTIPFKTKLNAATEQLKNELKTKISKKVVGKEVSIRASKGQQYQNQLDYKIVVKGVSIVKNPDDNDYMVVFVDQTNKQYFLVDGFKIKIAASTGTTPSTSNKNIVPQTPSSPDTVNKSPEQQGAA